MLVFAIVSYIDYFWLEVVTYSYDAELWSIVPFLAALLVLSVFLDALLLAVLLITSAVRFKTSTFIKSTLIYIVISFAFRILKKTSRSSSLT